MVFRFHLFGKLEESSCFVLHMYIPAQQLNSMAPKHGRKHTEMLHGQVTEMLSIHSKPILVSMKKANVVRRVLQPRKLVSCTKVQHSGIHKMDRLVAPPGKHLHRERLCCCFLFICLLHICRQCQHIGEFKKAWWETLTGTPINT